VLDGTFPDGSYKSIGTQFIYNLTHAVPVAAEIRVNLSVRGTTDIAWVEPTSLTVQARAVIAPTDPVHLCATFVTLCPLTPAVNDTGLALAWSNMAITGWADPGVANGSNAGGAIYDHQNGLLAFYCRTGDRAWYQRWYEWAHTMNGDPLNGITPAESHPDALPAILNQRGSAHLLLPAVLPHDHYAPPDYTHRYADCYQQDIWNPEPINGWNTSCGGPPEWFSLRHISLASAYWMSGWRQHKRISARFANQGLGWSANGTDYATQRDHWVSFSFGTRHNFGNAGMWSTLIGYLTGCTTTFDTPPGLSGPTAWNYATYLPWIIDALIETAFNLPGDYRNGTVGQRHTVIDEPGNPDSGISNFMISIPAEFLAMYYDCVKPDSRIPPLMQTLADYIISQSRPSVPGETLYPDKTVCAYRNVRPAAIADSTFTGSVVNGSPNLTYVSGTVHPDDFRDPDNPLIKLSGTGGWGPGGTTTQVNTAATSGATGSTPSTSTYWVMNQNATVTGTVNMLVPMSGWYLAMNLTLFAWVYAYTGNPLYQLWRDRAANVANLQLSYQTKIWGEFYGGARQSWLYYYQGGAIRGTPGVHPTVITNPPLQPTLG
jgi:hypothetical protein